MAHQDTPQDFNDCIEACEEARVRKARPVIQVRRRAADKH